MLIPNYHYMEIRSDFSDLEERLLFFIQHPEEAQRIINNAHEYVSLFMDKRRETLISLSVMQKYFHCTGQIQVS